MSEDDEDEGVGFYLGAPLPGYRPKGWLIHHDRQFLFDSIGPGWHGLLSEAMKEIFEADPKARILQVKEKFGELRIYVRANKIAQDVAWVANVKSMSVCEVCGDQGQQRTVDGFIYTLCPKHHQEYERGAGED